MTQPRGARVIRGRNLIGIRAAKSARALICNSASSANLDSAGRSFPAAMGMLRQLTELVGAPPAGCTGRAFFRRRFSRGRDFNRCRAGFDPRRYGRAA